MRYAKALAVAAALGVGSTLGLAEEARGGPDVDAARETVARWIATQRLIYQERKDWQQQKEILQSRIELVRKEIADLEAKLAEAQRTASDNAAKKAEAGAARQRLVAESDHLVEALSEFEARVRSIHALLPAPVQERIQPLFQRIPDDPHATKVAVAERFQNVLGIMNEVNKANGDILLATEVRTLSDGRPTEVKTVYLGLAQAYYLSAKGEAGVGRPSPSGWTWTPANDLAPRILEVVEILEGKAKPKFVPLPVKIS